MRLLIWTILLSAGTNAIAKAPAAGVQYLFEHPASLFDIGLARLPHEERAIQRIYRASSNSEKAFTDLSWRYERKEQRIYGDVLIEDDRLDVARTGRGCSAVLEQLAVMLSKSLPQIFLPADWDFTGQASQTERIDKDLKRMFTLRCVVHGAGREHSQVLAPWDP